jgi:hypothetical protein
MAWDSDVNDEIASMFAGLDVFDLWSGDARGFVARDAHWVPGSVRYELHKEAERERLARAAIAAGRTPGKVGRPRKTPATAQEAARLERARARDAARRPRKTEAA